MKIPCKAIANIIKLFSYLELVHQHSKSNKSDTKKKKLNVMFVT